MVFKRRKFKSYFTGLIGRFLAAIDNFYPERSVVLSAVEMSKGDNLLRIFWRSRFFLTQISIIQ